MEEILKFIKKHKIRYKKLAEEMGYSQQSMSKVLRGERNCSRQFDKLLQHALYKIANESVNELNQISEDRKWKN